MLKNISNFGQVITKQQQKNIQGGFTINECAFSADPSTDWCCHLPGGCSNYPG